MREIQKVSHPQDDHWFANKYKDYGITCRYDWYVWKTNKEHGESWNFIADPEEDKNSIAKTKGTGSSDYDVGDEEAVYDKKKRKKFVPPPFDIGDLFKFDYEAAFNYKPNKKFNRLFSLKFEHNFYNIDKDKKYQKFIEIYNEDLMNGNIDNINNLCQRISKYISDNNINMSNKVGGSVICNIALMISKYIKTGVLDTDIDFICKMSEEELNEEYNMYCLFLLCQVFTSKYHYVNQYICNTLIKEWWRICLIRHRNSDKDMKSKGIIPYFKKKGNEVSIEIY